MLLAAVAFTAFSPNPALALCSPPGALAPGSTVTCNGPQTTTEGQGPGADNVSVFVNDGATIDVSNANAISVGNNATVTLGTASPTAGGSAANAAVVVRTTTNASAGNGNYGDGSNTIDIGYNSTLVINRNASVIAIGTQQQSEAINPYGSGNTIINYGLIQGGPSSAINFQDVGSDASSPHNVVENYGTIQLSPVGSVNPISGGQAVSSAGTVGIDFINETGGKVIGNLVFQAGDDHVTLNPGSSISGDLDGEGGTNLLTLNASGTSADTFTGEIKNFQTVDKTGAGTWTLTGAIGNNSFTGVTPLAVNIIGGTLVLNGNNTAFNGSIAINPGTSLALPGSDPTATLEARAQSLPPLITDHGILLINQFSPDGIQPATQYQAAGSPDNQGGFAMPIHTRPSGYACPHPNGQGCCGGEQGEKRDDNEQKAASHQPLIWHQGRPEGSAGFPSHPCDFSLAGSVLWANTVSAFFCCASGIAA
jgi:fibronectin-binding autotransporter adhesin